MIFVAIKMTLMFVERGSAMVV